MAVISIGYEQTELREEIKRIGGRWDGERKVWTIPDSVSLPESLKQYSVGEKLRRQIMEKLEDFQFDKSLTTVQKKKMKAEMKKYLDGKPDSYFAAQDYLTVRGELIEAAKYAWSVVDPDKFAKSYENLEEKRQKMIREITEHKENVEKQLHELLMECAERTEDWEKQCQQMKAEAMKSASSLLYAVGELREQKNMLERAINVESPDPAAILSAAKILIQKFNHVLVPAQKESTRQTEHLSAEHEMKPLGAEAEKTLTELKEILFRDRCGK